MTLPNFLIIGAAKSGTTSLYNYIEQHPQIYVSPEKEPGFFAFEGQKVELAGPCDQERYGSQVVTDLNAYQSLFKGADGMAVGEASNVYLYNPKAPKRIKHYIPEIKLIAILRNPVDRAYSSFAFLISEGREPLKDFAQALQVEETRVNANWEHQWHYTRLGFYYSQLKRYFDLFHPDQIAVNTYDEFSAKPVVVLQDIFRFLCVDHTFIPDTSFQYNVAGIPKSRALRNFLSKSPKAKGILKLFIPAPLRLRLTKMAIRWNNSGVKPEFPEETRRYLVQLYREDILKLQQLISRDLSNWLET